MNKIVDRDTFMHYLNNADVNWEETARECIAKGFELAEENKKLKEKLEKIKELCQVPNEPYYNSECEFGKGRIDLGQEILKIIEGANNEQ